MPDNLMNDFITIVYNFKMIDLNYFYNYQSLFIVLALILAIITYFGNKIRKRKSPPCPWFFPFIGTLPWLENRPHLTFSKLSRKYGNIFQVKGGNWAAVILNNYSTIKEAFDKGKDSTLASRPDLYFRPLYSGYSSIFNKYGDDFTIRKKIVTQAIMAVVKDMNLHTNIKRTFQIVIEEFNKTNGQPFDPRLTLDKAVGQILTSLCYGTEFLKHEDLVTNLLKDIHTVSELRGPGNFPLSELFYPKKYSYYITKVESIQNLSLNLIKDMQKEKKAIFSLASLLKTEYQTDDGSVAKFSEADLATLSYEILCGGYIPTAAILQWTVLLLAAHPEIQAKIHNELDKALKLNNNNKFHSNPSAPLFIQATQLEILRFTSVVPLGISHFTSEDIVLEGYSVPKNTIVIPNLWSANHDPKIWKEPNKFNPNRFLNSKGTAIVPEVASQVITFGCGMRKCTGILLARMQLHFFLNVLMQNFRLEMASNDKIDFENCQSGIYLSPKPFFVSIVSRHKI